jgi:hypothetical protein
MQMTEGNYLGDLLKWEMDNNHSREIVLVQAGQNLAMGSVIGKITAGAVPTTGTAGTNTGGGTCASVTGGPARKVGVYELTCVAVVSGGGVFTVKDPEGLGLPNAYVGQAYTNPAINFTLVDGTPDFALGDSFKITVPAGSGRVKELDIAGIDGAAEAYGILIAGIDTTDTTKRQVAFTSGGDAELQPGDFVTGASSGAKAQVVSISLTSGDWASGTAAGVLVLDNQTGTFQSENLDAPLQSNICSIGANSIAYNPESNAVAIVRDAQIVADYLSWPAGITENQKTAAILQLARKGIVTRSDV